MIDFRYHLVSLVSVFLALAVGIVLGAGPLKESIGTTLTEQVQALRDEKDSLRVQLGTESTARQHRDDFLTAVAPSLVSDQLTNRSVAIVSLPDVEDDIDPLVDTITTAGGKVVGRVSLNGAWTDPAKADARAKVITDLTAALPTGAVPSDGDTEERLANLLAGALVSKGTVLIGQSTEASTTVLDALRSADLIEIKGNISGLAGGTLMLAPATAVGGAAVEAPPEGALAAYVSLATALDTAGGGAVVSGPASSATEGGVITAIRDDDDAKSKVSTVDSGSTPMGLITAVHALREQLSGGSAAAYGFGNGVGDLMPALVAAAPGVTPSPSAKR